MEKKKTLEPGKHLVTITNVYQGISENKKVPYISLRFENENGCINQRFYINELGRAKMRILFKEFNVEPEFYNDQGIKLAMDKIKGEKISLTVEIDQAGYKETLGWQKH